MEKEVEKLVCEACSEEAQKAGENQVKEFTGLHPGWQIKTEPDTTFLTRTFCFSDFVQAANFAAKVTDVAEQSSHHPRIVIEYGKTRVDWWSHKIGNIHELDLRLAAMTDGLFKG